MQDTLEREQFLNDSIKELKKVNKKLADLTLQKEELTANIIGALGHEHQGQSTYEYGPWKIECKTPATYSLDKKAYQSGSIFIPGEFDPIKESVSYSVDKKLCEKYMATSPKNVRDSLLELITVKPGKPSVTIKERC
jgi:hypothetical protein